jgi:hypothetical protein
MLAGEVVPGWRTVSTPLEAAGWSSSQWLPTMCLRPEFPIGDDDVAAKRRETASHDHPIGWPLRECFVQQARLCVGANVCCGSEERLSRVGLSNASKRGAQWLRMLDDA